MVVSASASRDQGLRHAMVMETHPSRTGWLCLVSGRQPRLLLKHMHIPTCYGCEMLSSRGKPQLFILSVDIDEWYVSGVHYHQHRRPLSMSISDSLMLSIRCHSIPGMEWQLDRGRKGSSRGGNVVI